MPDIEFPTSHGPTPGYLASPAGEQGPATIVLQEWWGLDSHIRSVCDRFAAAGFFALAPDLYRGETAEGPDEAQQKMMALSMETVEKDMCGAAEYLDSLPGVQGPEVGSVGFCLGGACRCGPRRPARTSVRRSPSTTSCPTESPTSRRSPAPSSATSGPATNSSPRTKPRRSNRSSADAGVRVSFQFYENAGHAFFNDTNRLGTYDAEAAELAWERTLSFLREALGG